MRLFPAENTINQTTLANIIALLSKLTGGLPYGSRRLMPPPASYPYQQPSSTNINNRRPVPMPTFPKNYADFIGRTEKAERGYGYRQPGILGILAELARVSDIPV